ncbi:MAG: efflux RND transporter permease subunit, partial [Elusimicrobia bacterium]|nr:efflux RND transporter permease subunit [Elusimicrobiota bacterium]
APGSEDIARAALTRAGPEASALSLSLGDAAEVKAAPEPPTSAAQIMGQDGVVLMISEQYRADTLRVTRALARAMAALRPALAAQGIELHDRLFRSSDFISTALRNVRFSLLLGAILVVAVLTLILFDARTAAISCAAMPLSLLAAAVILEKAGLSLNTMTLGGMAIAIGEVVDDAVIDVENILRRLRENRAAPRPRTPARVVLEASVEVRGAVVYVTFAVIMVFVPVLTMSGLAGRLFAPLGAAYVLAVLSSLGVALTVTPALALVLLGGARLSGQDPPLMRRLRARYERTLTRIEGRPKLAAAGAAAVTACALAALPFFGGEFMPRLREGHFIVHAALVPGSSLETSLELGKLVTARLLGAPHVRSVAQRIGMSEKSDDVMGTFESELEVDLEPVDSRGFDEALGGIRSALSRFIGAGLSVNTFLTERINETVSGYTAPVAVKIFGEDLDTLDRLARKAARILGATPGAQDVRLQSPLGAPRLEISLREDRLARWGLEPVPVWDAIRTAYQGAAVSQVYEGLAAYDVAVILDPARRADPAAVGDMRLRTAAGAFVPLRELAYMRQDSGRYGISHEGGRRAQIVTCSVRGRAVKAFSDAVKKAMAAGLRLPRGSYLEVSGAAEEQSRASRELYVHAAAAAACIILLLAVVLRSGRNLALVLVNLPFALAGGLLAALAAGRWISIGSLVGFVTVFGITLRNSVMLLSHYEHLVEAEGLAWGPEAARRGASERLTPILLTALVTGAGLLPLALGSGDPGREVEGPMAIVILGGLATSTALNLLLLPALALRYGRFEKRSGEAV